MAQNDVCYSCDLNKIRKTNASQLIIRVRATLIMGHYDSRVYNDNLAVSAELNSTLTRLLLTRLLDPIIRAARQPGTQTSIGGAIQPGEST